MQRRHAAPSVLRFTGMEDARVAFTDPPELLNRHVCLHSSETPSLRAEIDVNPKASATHRGRQRE